MNLFGPSGRQPSNSQQHFSQIPRAEIQRSVFDRSSTHKTTCNSGLLIPIYADEVLPGDTINLHSSIFARLATPLTPFMDNVYCDVQWFFVPNRLLWNNWERFNGAQDNPDDSTDFLVPQIALTTETMLSMSLFDYLGIPPGVGDVNVAAWWTRAYNLIWNEWYRDENLQDSVVVDKGDGPDDPADYVLLRRGKRKDYFTSALPWPQKGPAVTIPLLGNAPVLGIGKATSGWNSGASGPLYTSDGTFGTNYDPWNEISDLNSGTKFIAKGKVISGVTYPDFYADLSEASSATINMLRTSFQYQRFLERDARGGTRYTEILLSHFGVTAPDFRLQRPELLGTSSTRVNVNPIAQTSETADTPQGTLSAVGTLSSVAPGFGKSFVEHGVILGLMSIRADLTYQQGANRMFFRRTREDFYWPAFSHLGEQSILNREIYLQGDNAAEDTEVFGYQERYAEYRYKPSIITGLQRSNVSAGFQTLDIWNLSQDFEELPDLDSIFIQENPPIQRVVAVKNPKPEWLVDMSFRVKHARPMPVYSVPGLIDHF